MSARCPPAVKPVHAGSLPPSLRGQKCRPEAESGCLREGRHGADHRGAGLPRVLGISYIQSGSPRRLWLLNPAQRSALCDEETPRPARSLWSCSVAGS